MSYKGLDFNGNGKVSRTESRLTYNIIREGAKNNSFSSSSSYSPPKSSSDYSSPKSSATVSPARNSANSFTHKKEFVIILIICVLIYIAIAIVGGVVSATNAKRDTEENYQQVIEEIIEGNYSWALQLLGGLKKQDYKDSEYLYYYMQSLNTNNSFLANKYLEKIPEDYSGIFADDIALEKINYEERCRKATEKENNFLNKISTKIPYVGLDNEYINNTIVGECDEFNYDIQVGKGIMVEYNWYSKDGEKKLVLYVHSTNGVVDKVKKYSENKYWTKDGKPDFYDNIEETSYSGYSSGKFIPTKKNMTHPDSTTQRISTISTITTSEISMRRKNTTKITKNKAFNSLSFLSDIKRV